VCDRLPLLAGGELTGSDRRKVERHLIGCPGCRARHASLAGVLGVLHAAATATPAPGRPPALWPALERQIREARHAQRPLTTSALAWLDALAAAVRPRVVLATGLALALTAGTVGLWARRQVADARENARVALVPIAPAPRAPAPRPSALDPVAAPLPLADPEPRIAQADTADTVRTPDRGAGTAAPRLDYDLDLGTPMGTGARDVGIKPSY
jgi:hypothetical protein